MLDDLTKEIKAQLYERVKSPLFGAFALSWAAWNSRSSWATRAMMPTVRLLASGISAATNLTPESLSVRRKAAFRERRSSLAMTRVEPVTWAWCRAFRS